MSIPEKNSEKKQVNDAISINENGEVVIRDPKLAIALQELSVEDLDAIAGGCGTTVNTASGCGVKEQ